MVQQPILTLKIAEAKHDPLLAMSTPDAPFTDRDDRLQLNENILFGPERSMTVGKLGEGIARREEIGKLTLESGVLGILDFGYDIYDFEPLHKKVNPGVYLVEAVKFQTWVAGVRVLFKPHEPAVKWYAANTPRNDDIYGVDAGNLAIVDVHSLVGLSRIKKERLFDQWAACEKSQLISMTSENDGLITLSGFGDGAYPAFWGVNEKDEIVSLYIDFMILIEKNQDGSFVSL